MREYIKQTDKGRICIHPKVIKYHEWGGGSENGPFYHYASIELKDGTKEVFSADGDRYKDVIEKSNEFLNTIPE